MAPNKAFGMALREHRKRKNKTQAELAFAAELDRTYISLLELGQRSPTIDTIFSLSGALGIRVSTLITSTEEYALSTDD